jgi:hypothetical protein
MKLSKILFMEAAVPFEDIKQSEMALKVIKHGTQILLILYRPSMLTKYVQTWEQEDLDGLIVGMLSMVPSEESNKIYEVKAIAAENDHGPVMYDIAMSYIKPNYLMADRSHVSDAARKVWAYTFNNRLSEFNTIKVGEDSKWMDSEGNEVPFLNLAYKIKKELPISSVITRDKQFFANEPRKNTREEMLKVLEEEAWVYFREKMGEE